VEFDVLPSSAAFLSPVCAQSDVDSKELGYGAASVAIDLVVHDNYCCLLTSLRLRYC
jgi:hypothetical protein